MKLIFVRHGEPDYTTDSLTENGKKEALALSKRIKNWDVDKFYVSPLGRAKETASYSLKELNAEATELPFMREFSYPIDDPVTGRHGVPWDFVPSDWTSDPCNFELEDGFSKFECVAKRGDISEKYKEAIEGFDKMLEEHGFKRCGKYYKRCDGRKRFVSSTVSEDDKVRNNSPYGENEKEETVVIFCHLGVTCIILSHLLNIPFECLTHGFFMPTSSITILSTEERWDDEAYFRVQALGDCTHLKDAGLPISPAGYFASPFQG